MEWRKTCGITSKLFMSFVYTTRFCFTSSCMIIMKQCNVALSVNILLLQGVPLTAETKEAVKHTHMRHFIC